MHAGKGDYMVGKSRNGENQKLVFWSIISTYSATPLHQEITSQFPAEEKETKKFSKEQWQKLVIYLYEWMNPCPFFVSALDTNISSMKKVSFNPPSYIYIYIYLFIHDSFIFFTETC